jgi:chromosome segregation ATPase
MTIDERLEALTQSLELMVLRQNDAEERASAAEERHNREIERHNREIEDHNREMERHNREMEEIRREARAMRTELRRAFVMGVQEARNQRRRSQELDQKITQLAAAQLVTEEKLQRFIDSVRRAGNGNT